MNKKGYSDFVSPILVLLLIIGGIEGYFWVEHNHKVIRETEQDCGGFYSYQSGYSCCQDCNRLDLEYFRYEFAGSFFGASIENCYCKEDNDIKQIW